MPEAEIQEILFDEQTIQCKVGELAERISADYADKELLLVCILKGAAIFVADLMRHITIPVTIEFIQASSYGAGTISSKEVTISNDRELDISGRHVLLVDTIIDTGETMACMLRMFAERGPASLKAVALLDKRSRRTKDVPLSYIGFEIPDQFVVGYGMDYAGRYRNLPSIAVLQANAT